MIESSCQCRRRGFDLWVGNIPGGGNGKPAPVFLPGKFHGERSLVGYSQVFVESNLTVTVHIHTRAQHIHTIDIKAHAYD